MRENILDIRIYVINYIINCSKISTSEILTTLDELGGTYK